MASALARPAQHCLLCQVNVESRPLPSPSEGAFVVPAFQLAVHRSERTSQTYA